MSSFRHMGNSGNSTNRTLINPWASAPTSVATNPSWLSPFANPQFPSMGGTAFSPFFGRPQDSRPSFNSNLKSKSRDSWKPRSNSEPRKPRNELRHRLGHQKSEPRSAQSKKSSSIVKAVVSKSQPDTRFTHELYVGNYAKSYDMSELKKLFDDKSIKTVGIRMLGDRKKCFAFVGVESNEEMQKASSLLNGKEIDGRILRVRPADQFKKNQKQDNKLKRTREPTEKDIPRHLAVAIIDFLDRQITLQSSKTDQIKKIEEAKVAIKEAFALPDDAKDLQTSQRLEAIFFSANRQAIKINCGHDDEDAAKRSKMEETSSDSTLKADESISQSEVSIGKLSETDFFLDAQIHNEVLFDEGDAEETDDQQTMEEINVLKEGTTTFEETENQDEESEVVEDISKDGKEKKPIPGRGRGRGRGKSFRGSKLGST